jgi:hypothetical protein
MSKKNKQTRKAKRKVNKVVLAAGEVAAVEVPTGYSPLVAPVAEKRVEIVPVKKKTSWWASLFSDV